MVSLARNATFPVQTRLFTGNLPHQRANSFATAIACLMGLSDPEEVLQVQEIYDRDSPDDPKNWVFQLEDWLNERGYTWQVYKGHLMNDKPYMVAGDSPRGTKHICIYLNGKLLHDPHPDGGGLLTEEDFEAIELLSEKPTQLRYRPVMEKSN